MNLLPDRLKFWLVTMGVGATHMATIALFAQHNLYRELATYVPNLTNRIAALLALLVGGVVIARHGYARDSSVVQLLGVAGLHAAYGFIGTYVLRLKGIPDPVFAVKVAWVIAALYFSALFVYAYLSNRSFATWDAKAVLVLLSAGLLGVAGYYAHAILLVTFIVAFIALVMHTLHVIGRTQQERLRPFKHALRLYVAIVGFAVELLLYLLRALRRLIF